MTHLRTPEWSHLYESDLARQGYVANYTRVFALAPNAFAAWLQLGAAVRTGMDGYRYELVTMAAARRLGSRYCTLAHASVLRTFHDDDTVRAIIADHRSAGLDPADVAVMDFAELIAVDPAAAGVPDHELLRRHGLSDVDIFQIVLAVGIRRFFTGVLAATGAVPDPAYDAVAELLENESTTRSSTGR